MVPILVKTDDVRSGRKAKLGFGSYTTPTGVEHVDFMLTVDLTSNTDNSPLISVALEVTDHTLLL